jgi:hypothetical protein
MRHEMNPRRWLARLSAGTIFGLGLAGAGADAADSPQGTGAGAAAVTNNASDATLRQVSSNVFQLGAIRIDRAQRSVRFPAVLNMEAGLIEYLLVSAQGKTHESLLRTDVSPRQIHLAMLLLGAKGAGTNLFPADHSKPLPGDNVIVELNWTDAGKVKRVRAEDTVRDRRTGTGVRRGPWTYTGSRVMDGLFLAQELGSIVALMEDPDALVNNPRPRREDDENWEIKPDGLPLLESPVEVEIRLEANPPDRPKPKAVEEKRR